MTVQDRGRGRPRMRSVELTNQILSMFKSTPARQIAKQLNIPLHTVYNTIYADRWKPLPPQLHKRRKILPEDVPVMQEMYSRGVPVAQISSHFLVSDFTVRYHLFDDVRQRNLMYKRTSSSKTLEEAREAQRDYNQRRKEYNLSLKSSEV